MLLIKLNKFHWIRKTLSNKAAKSNNNNEIDAVFLLRTGESLDIKTDYFNKSLKPLLSRHRIVKSLKSLSWAVKGDLKLQMVFILPFILLNVIYLCAH